MKLLYQTHSPYARKVLVAAYEMGLRETLAIMHHETSPTRRNEAVVAVNPLGQVPVLICDDGEQAGMGDGDGAGLLRRRRPRQP